MVFVVGWLAVGGHLPHWRTGAVSELHAVLAEQAPRFALVLFWWRLGWHFLVGLAVDPPLAG